MSKIGKKSIAIPSGVTVTIEHGGVHVKGSRGIIAVPLLRYIAIAQAEESLQVTPANNSQQAHMNWGTMHALLENALAGVTKGFEKKLEIEGVGFKAQMEGDALILKVGFSHPVRFPVPEGITITVEKNKILIQGNNKQIVGQIAADIRKIKKPEPYLGKGIRYEGEVIRRKDGKKAGTTK